MALNFASKFHYLSVSNLQVVIKLFTINLILPNCQPPAGDQGPVCVTAPVDVVVLWALAPLQDALGGPGSGRAARTCTLRSGVARGRIYIGGRGRFAATPSNLHSLLPSANPKCLHCREELKARSIERRCRLG